MKVINLLPPQEQEVLKSQKVLIAIRAFIIFSLLSYVCVAAVLFVGRYYLKSSLSTLDSQIKKQQDIIAKQDIPALKKQITADNGVYKDYNSLVSSNPNWSKVLIGFAPLVPSDVEIVNLSADAVSGKIDITGKAATRESVLALHANIEASPLFENIDLPLDNLQRPTNLNFHYTFYLSPDALKN